ncbi:hypothetical protein Peur_006627 [Populus x canadensis]
MVMLAEKVRQRLLPGSSSQSSYGDDEEMDSKEEMKDWLLSVGIISPVTKESAGAMYHQQLSCQLADFVRFPLKKAGGVINQSCMDSPTVLAQLSLMLIDPLFFLYVFCIQLISPEDWLRALSLWEKFDVYA